MRPAAESVSSRATARKIRRSSQLSDIAPLAFLQSAFAAIRLYPTFLQM
jgi:hypothetical protein